jgi:hypothetical protein
MEATSADAFKPTEPTLLPDGVLGVQLKMLRRSAGGVVLHKIIEKQLDRQGVLLSHFDGRKSW